MDQPLSASEPSVFVGVDVSKGRLDVRPLITHRFPIDRINEAFDTARDKPGTGAVFVAIEI